MDGLDGSTDGAPPMTDYAFEKQWYRVTQAEYRRLLHFAHRGERTLLDHYGATNRAEFFAVATESFFAQPHALAEAHSELFAVLARLFGQDPRVWLPATAGTANGTRGAGET
jgi:Mlc titration factor MtfA (ptsG expression regulator)